MLVLLKCIILFQVLKIFLSRNSYNSKLILLTWTACIGSGQTHVMWNMYLSLFSAQFFGSLSLSPTNSLSQRTYTALKCSLFPLRKNISNRHYEKHMWTMEIHFKISKKQRSWNKVHALERMREDKRQWEAEMINCWKSGDSGSGSPNGYAKSQKRQKPFLAMQNHINLQC